MPIVLSAEPRLDHGRTAPVALGSRLRCARPASSIEDARLSNERWQRGWISLDPDWTERPRSDHINSLQVWPHGPHRRSALAQVLVSAESCEAPFWKILSRTQEIMDVVGVWWGCEFWCASGRRSAGGVVSNPVGDASIECVVARRLAAVFGTFRGNVYSGVCALDSRHLFDCPCLVNSSQHAACISGDAQSVVLQVCSLRLNSVSFQLESPADSLHWPCQIWLEEGVPGSSRGQFLVCAADCGGRRKLP